MHVVCGGGEGEDVVGSPTLSLRLPALSLLV